MCILLSLKLCLGSWQHLRPSFRTFILYQVLWSFVFFMELTYFIVFRAPNNMQLKLDVYICNGFHIPEVKIWKHSWISLTPYKTATIMKFDMTRSWCLAYLYKNLTLKIKQIKTHPIKGVNKDLCDKELLDLCSCLSDLNI